MLTAIPSAAERLPSDMVIDIALCEELFHTATGTAFADIIIEGHREAWPIRSKRFRAWLRRCYYQATGEAASAAEIRSALDLLEARAQFDGPERIVHIRTAERAGHLYSISPMSTGAPSISDLTDGGSLNLRPCASAGRPVCCRCPYPSAAGPLRPLIRSSIFRAGTTLC